MTREVNALSQDHTVRVKPRLVWLQISCSYYSCYFLWTLWLYRSFNWYPGIEITILWKTARKQGLVWQCFRSLHRKEPGWLQQVSQVPVSVAFTEANRTSGLSHPQSESYPEAVLSRHLRPTLWLAVSFLNTRATLPFSHAGNLLMGDREPILLLGGPVTCTWLPLVGWSLRIQPSVFVISCHLRAISSTSSLNSDAPRDSPFVLSEQYNPLAMLPSSPIHMPTTPQFSFL